MGKILPVDDKNGRKSIPLRESNRRKDQTTTVQDAAIVTLARRIPTISPNQIASNLGLQLSHITITSRLNHFGLFWNSNRKTWRRNMWICYRNRLKNLLIQSGFVGKHSRKEWRQKYITDDTIVKRNQVDQRSDVMIDDGKHEQTLGGDEFNQSNDLNIPNAHNDDVVEINDTEHHSNTTIDISNDDDIDKCEQSLETSDDECNDEDDTNYAERLMQLEAILTKVIVENLKLTIDKEKLVIDKDKLQEEIGDLHGRSMPLAEIDERNEYKRKLRRFDSENKNMDISFYQKQVQKLKATIDRLHTTNEELQHKIVDLEAIHSKYGEEELRKFSATDDNDADGNVLVEPNQIDHCLDTTRIDTCDNISDDRFIPTLETGDRDDHNHPNDLNMLDDAKNKYDERLKQLEGELKEVRNEKRNLTIHLEECVKRILQLDIENDDLKRRNMELLQIPDKKNEYKQKPQTLESETEKQLKPKNNEFTFYQGEINNLLNQNAKLRSENLSLTINQEQGVKQLEKMEAEISQLKLKNKELNFYPRQVRVLKTTVDHLYSHNAEIQPYIVNLEEIHSKCDQKLRVSAMDNVELTTRVNHLHGQNATLRQTVNQLRGSYADLHKRNLDLQQIEAEFEANKQYLNIFKTQLNLFTSIGDNTFEYVIADRRVRLGIHSLCINIDDDDDEVGNQRVHNEKIEQLKSEIARLNQRNVELNVYERQVGELKTTIDRLCTNNTKLQQKVADLEKIRSENEEKLQQLSAMNQNVKLTEKIDYLDGQNAILQNALTRLQSNIDDLQKRNMDLLKIEADFEANKQYINMFQSQIKLFTNIGDNTFEYVIDDRRIKLGIHSTFTNVDDEVCKQSAPTEKSKQLEAEITRPQSNIHDLQKRNLELPEIEARLNQSNAELSAYVAAHKKTINSLYKADMHQKENYHNIQQKLVIVEGKLEKMIKINEQLLVEKTEVEGKKTELEEKLDNLQGRVAELQTQKAPHLNSQQTSQDNYNTLRTKLDQVEERLQTMTTINKKLVVEKTELEDELDNLQGQMTKLQTEKVLLQNNLPRSKNNYNTLRRKLVKVEQKLQTVTAINDQLKIVKTELEEKLDNQNGQMTKLRTEAVLRIRDMKRSQINFNQLQRKLVKVEEKLQTVTAINDQLKLEKTELEEKLDNQNGQVIELQTEKVLLQNNLPRSKNNYNTLRRKLVKVEEKLQTVTAINDQLKIEKTELEEKLDNQNGQVIQLQTEKVLLQNNLQTSKNDYNTQLRKVAQLEKNLQTVMASIDQLKVEKTTFEEKVFNLQAQVAELTSTIDGLRTTNLGLQQQILELEEIRDKYKAELQRLSAMNNNEEIATAPPLVWNHEPGIMKVDKDEVLFLHKGQTTIRNDNPAPIVKIEIEDDQLAREIKSEV